MRNDILKSERGWFVRWLFITIAAVFFIMCSYHLIHAEESAILQNFKRGDTLPTIDLATLNDRIPRSFTPGKGRPSVIMFFSIRPDFRKKRSLALLGSMASLAEQYKTEIDIIGIFSDSQKTNIVKTFMDKSNLNITVYNDWQKRVYNKYGVFMMPLVVMSDREGKLHEVIPYTHKIREIVESNIKFLLGEWDKDELIRSLKPQENDFKSAEEKEYIRRVNYGRIMHAKKMYRQAVREFSTAAKLMPRLTEAHIGLGFALLKSKKFDKAEAAFREALHINPQSDEAIAGLGLVHYSMDDVETALVELEKAFISPEPRLDVIITLAEIYEAQGDNDRANRFNKLAVNRLMNLYEKRWK